MRRLIATRVRLPLAVLATAVVYGTVGFHILEGFGFIDAPYMTVSTPHRSRPRNLTRSAR